MVLQCVKAACHTLSSPCALCPMHGLQWYDLVLLHQEERDEASHLVCSVCQQNNPLPVLLSRALMSWVPIVTLHAPTGVQLRLRSSLSVLDTHQESTPGRAFASRTDATCAHLLSAWRLGVRDMLLSSTALLSRVAHVATNRLPTDLCRRHRL